MLPVTLAQAGATEVCDAGDRTSALCEWILMRTDNEFLAQASDTFLVKPAKVLLILVIALVVIRILRRAINRFLGGLRGDRVGRKINSLREMAPDAILAGPSVRTHQRAEALGALLRSAVAVAVWSVAAVMMLGQLGIAVGPLLAGAGIVGVAIGFGSQHAVRDMLAGLFMLVEDQYGVGDIIDTGPATGVVEGITLRTTKVRDVNGTLWHVPNGTIDRVGNFSQQWARALLDIEVAYDTDIARARRVIAEVAVEMSEDPAWSARILERPEVWGVETLGANGIAIRLVVKTQPLTQWEVARELRYRIKNAFDAEGIEIPFPQRVVWNRTEAAEEER